MTSDIKLVSYSITMMHGPIYIRCTVKLFVQWDPIVYIKTGNIIKLLLLIKTLTL